MTSEEFVKERMPKARAEKQETRRGENYWLIRDRGNTMYFSCGNSESNAWVNAKKQILESENKNV
jgi:hypothetical protein